MRIFFCPLLIALLAPTALAQNDLSANFHCVVKFAQSVNDKGKIVRNGPASEQVKGARFSVERDSGKIQADWHQNNAPTVFWDGTKTQAPTVYLAEDIYVAPGGVMFSFFQVVRHKTRKLRPFVWQTPNLILTGLCK